MALNGGNVFRFAEQKGSHKVSIITTDTSSVLFHFCEQPMIKSIVFNDTQRENAVQQLHEGMPFNVPRNPGKTIKSR